MKIKIILMAFAISACAQAADEFNFQALKRLYNSVRSAPRISDFTELPGKDRWICRGASKLTEGNKNVKTGLSIGTATIGGKNPIVCVEDGWLDFYDKNKAGVCTGNTWTPQDLVINYNFYDVWKRKQHRDTVSLRKVGEFLVGFQTGYEPISSSGEDGPPYYFYCYSSKYKHHKRRLPQDQEAIDDFLSSGTTVDSTP